jgi:gas vesicle structural protein
MTTPSQSASTGVLDRPTSSGLADVVDTILDKGLVIDAFVRVAVVGIELVTIDARVVVASVDTYLKFAEAVNRLELAPREEQGLPGLAKGVTEGSSKGKVKGATAGAIEAAEEKLRDYTNSHGRRERSTRRADDEED